jgi:transposase
LNFLYKDTKELYGSTGNPSIDQVVFFKLMLTGYLENITSDRKLIEHCAIRLDILYFLGYDIDEELPWHSTIQQYPDFKVFIKRIAAEGDLVWIQCYTQDTPNDRGKMSMDIFRIKEGKVAEHWDIIQAIPEGVTPSDMYN